VSTDPVPVNEDGLSVLDDAAPEGHVVRLRLGHHAGRAHQHHGQRVEEGGVRRHSQDLGLLRTSLLAHNFDAVKAAHKKLG